MDDLYLLASEAPGVLDGWTGPVEMRSRLGKPDDWRRQTICPDNNPTDLGLLVRLPLSRPEVRDRLVRWLEARQPPSGLRVEPNGNATLTLSRPAIGALRDSPAALLAEVRAVAATLTPPADLR